MHSSTDPPSVAAESSVRSHIIQNSVDPKFRYGSSELKMLRAIRELCGGEVPPAPVDDQLPASVPEAAPRSAVVPLPEVNMLTVRGIDVRVDVCVRMCAHMRIGKFVGVWTNMRIQMRIHMCIDVLICVDMCIVMHMDMYMHCA